MVVEPAATTEQPSARFEIGLLGEPIDPEFTIDRYYILGRQLGTYVAIRRPGEQRWGCCALTAVCVAVANAVVSSAKCTRRPRWPPTKCLP